MVYCNKKVLQLSLKSLKFYQNARYFSKKHEGGFETLQPPVLHDEKPVDERREFLLETLTSINPLRMNVATNCEKPITSPDAADAARVEVVALKSLVRDQRVQVIKMLREADKVDFTLSLDEVLDSEVMIRSPGLSSCASSQKQHQQQLFNRDCTKPTRDSANSSIRDETAVNPRVTGMRTEPSSHPFFSVAFLRDLLHRKWPHLLPYITEEIMMRKWKCGNNFHVDKLEDNWDGTLTKKDVVSMFSRQFSKAIKEKDDLESLRLMREMLELNLKPTKDDFLGVMQALNDHLRAEKVPVLFQLMNISGVPRGDSHAVECILALIHTNHISEAWYAISTLPIEKKLAVSVYEALFKKIMALLSKPKDNRNESYFCDSHDAEDSGDINTWDWKPLTDGRILKILVCCSMNLLKAYDFQAKNWPIKVMYWFTIKHESGKEDDLLRDLYRKKLDLAIRRERDSEFSTLSPIELQNFTKNTASLYRNKILLSEEVPKEIGMN